MKLLMLAFLMQSNYEDLQHQNPIVRRNAASTLKEKKERGAIPYLIEGLNDEVREVREECYEALRIITGQTDIPPVSSEWKNWHKKTTSPPVRMDEGEILGEIKRIEKEISGDKERINRFAKYLTGGAVVFVLLYVIAFLILIAYVSSKLKEWRETVKKAEYYINECNIISSKVNNVVNELDRKRIDITEAILNFKKEAQDELDRYTELLQQNLDHRLKLEITGAKQSAEVELGHTVNETKKQIEEKLQSVQSMFEEKALKVNNEIEYLSTYIKAESAYNNKEYDEALKLYARLNEIKPSDKMIWLRLGNILTKINKLDEAIKYYETATEKLKEESLFHYKLASLYAIRHDKKNMLKHLKLLKSKNGHIEKVANDSVFANYFHDPDFKSMIELS